jgi:hypothetical protein
MEKKSCALPFPIILNIITSEKHIKIGNDSVGMESTNMLLPPRNGSLKIAWGLKTGRGT